MEIRERLKYIGGGMELQSAAGSGTTVRLFVPTELRRNVQELEAIEATDPAPANPPALARRSPTTRCRILVADDHAIFREGLLNLLSQDPELEIVGEAADGQEAVDLTLRLKPDILLVDVTMPKLSGIEVTTRLVRDMPNLKIVGLSMHEHRDISARCSAPARRRMSPRGVLPKRYSDYFVT